ncbi:outer membrane lipoprotein [Pseudomonas aeruginosa]|nr:outer membrane lipoprotein [Pseudomonas aeruginosa]
MMRFRPIMMTTLAALLGALPLIFRHRRRRRAAPAAGHHHRRRADRQPVADPVHPPGGLPLSRPPAPLGQPETRRTHGRCAGDTPMKHTPSLLALALVAALGGCAIGPRLPATGPGGCRRIQGSEGWRRAEPRDVFQRGAWWELYGDQTLNDLQMHLERSNQTLAQSGGAVPPGRGAGARARGRRSSRRSPATRARPAAARAAAIAPCCCREARR